MDPNVARNVMQLLVVVGMFAFVAAVFSVAFRVVFKRVKKRSFERESPVVQIDEVRFTRLEQAVDSIALELERMTEAQRFTMKLMTDRPVDRITEKAKQQ